MRSCSACNMDSCWRSLAWTPSTKARRWLMVRSTMWRMRMDSLELSVATWMLASTAPPPVLASSAPWKEPWMVVWTFPTGEAVFPSLGSECCCNLHLGGTHFSHNISLFFILHLIWIVGDSVWGTVRVIFLRLSRRVVACAWMRGRPVGNRWFVSVFPPFFLLIPFGWGPGYTGMLSLGLASTV